METKKMEDSAAWLQTKVRNRGLGLRPRLYAGSVSDNSATEAAYVAIMALYIYINEP